MSRRTISWICVGVVIFAVGSSLDAGGILTPLKARQARAAIEKLGGKVASHDIMAGPGFGTARVHVVDFSGVPLTDEQLAAAVPHLKNLGHLRHLNLRGTQVTDGGAASLKAAGCVDGIDATNARITAKGIAALRAGCPTTLVVDNSGPRSFDHRSCHDLVFSPDGKRLAIVGRDTTEIWDTDARKRTAKIPGGNAGAFSADGKRFAIAGIEGSIVWDLDLDRKTLTIPLRTQSPHDAAFSGDGKSLFISEFGAAHQYDAATGKYLNSFSATLAGAARNQAGLNLGTRAEAMLHPDRGELRGKLPDVPAQLQFGVLSGDGTRAAWIHSPALNPVDKPAIHIVDLQTGKEIREIPQPQRILMGGSFDAKAARLAAGGQVIGKSGGLLQIFDVATGKVLLSIDDDPAGPVTRVALSADGRKVAAAFGSDSAFGNGSVRWWPIDE